MSKCPNKITEECKDCGSHCYCDRWKGYQQGRDDGYSKAETDYFKRTEEDRQRSYEFGYRQGRADAISEILKYVGGDFVTVPAVYGTYQTGYMSAFNDVKKFAEQMKEQDDA